MHRAIETRYKGRRFRSRLEARYAVLFDALEIRWDYEPEGFELGGGLRYLPDFFLHRVVGNFNPGDGFWVEIKPLAPTQQELRKMALLIGQTGKPGYFFVGPPSHAKAYSIRPHTNTYHEDANGLALCAPLALCARRGPEQCMTDGDHAIQQALSARFEFGESGAPNV